MDLEQAQAEAASAAAEARRASMAAGAANITRDGNGVIVASPIAGRVTSENVSLGAFVQPETELFRVADPRPIGCYLTEQPAFASPDDRPFPLFFARSYRPLQRAEGSHKLSRALCRIVAKPSMQISLEQ